MLIPNYVHDPLVNEEGYITPQWTIWFDQLITQLQANFSNESLVAPTQTTAAINDYDLAAKYPSGALLYDSTSNQLKVRLANGQFNPIEIGSGYVSQLNQGTGITLTPNPIIDTGTIAIADTSVTAGTYSYPSSVTVNAQGQLTAITGSAGTPITAVTASLPLTSTGGATPNIALNVPLAITYGGTGQNTLPTDGQILIGRTSGNTFTPNTLTAGSGVSITNGAGTVTISATGSGGTVTSISAGTGITASPNPITSTGTISVANTGVTPGLYSYLSQVSINAQGQITSAMSASTPVTSVTASLPLTSTGGVAPNIALNTPLAMAYGGTNASLTADNGAIAYSTGSALALLASTATANQVLLSGSSSAPAWSSATYPATTTANQLLYSSATNTVAGLTSANNSVLVTDGSGVPSWSTTLPDIITGSITIQNPDYLAFDYIGSGAIRFEPADWVTSTSGAVKIQNQAGGLTSASDFYIIPGYKGTTLTDGWCTFSMPGTGELYIWENLTVSGTLDVEGTLINGVNLHLTTNEIFQTSTNDIDDSNSILFQNSGGYYTWRIGRRWDGGNDPSNTARLVISGGAAAAYTSLSDILSIDDAGYVGINTSFPQESLHIATGTIRVNALGASKAVVTDASKNFGSLSYDANATPNTLVLRGGSANITSNYYYAANGTSATPAYSFSSEQTSGLYHRAAGDVRMSLSGSDVQRWTSVNTIIYTNIIPDTHNAYNLGNGSTYYSRLYVSNIIAGGSAIFRGLTANQAVVTNGSKQLTSLAYATGRTASSLVQRDASSDITTNLFYGANGTVGAPTFSFTNDTDSGLYLAGASDVRMAIAGTYRTRWLGADTRFNCDVVPATDTTYDLGSTSLRWQIFYGNYVAFGGQTSFDANIVMQGPNSSLLQARCYGWNTYSDKDLKQDIEPGNDEDDLKTVVDMPTAVYRWVEGNGDNIEGVKPQRHRGFIAQDIYQYAPEMCAQDEEGVARSIDYGKLSRLYAGAIKALVKRVESLENMLNSRS